MWSVRLASTKFYLVTQAIHTNGTDMRLMYLVWLNLVAVLVRSMFQSVFEYGAYILVSSQQKSTIQVPIKPHFQCQC